MLVAIVETLNGTNSRQTMTQFTPDFTFVLSQCFVFTRTNCLYVNINSRQKEQL